MNSESRADDVPPAYGIIEAPNIGESTGSQLHIDFTSLDLEASNKASFPTADACLIHLRLLYAIEILKTKIGHTNGLWDIWDQLRTDSTSDASNAHHSNGSITAKLCEKRWAIYVARAVDRYEAWWKSFVPDMLKEADMLEKGTDKTTKYEGFTVLEDAIEWTAEMIPPIDVLIVWHTHMLNPRLFLEDCLRHGYGTFWRAGIPWAIINNAINGATFEYNINQACEAQWTERTGRPWFNQEDSETKQLQCPSCSEGLNVAWTSCGQPQDSKRRQDLDLSGQGYGDGNFQTLCIKCNTTIDEDLLRVGKFREDVRNLVRNDWPMPGTILDGSGLGRRQTAESDQLFPNRLVRRGILVEVSNLMESSTKPTMMLVRNKIQEVTAHTQYRHSSDRLKKVDKGTEGVLGTLVPHRLSRSSRMQTRAMMSRYWENSSMFALDLRNAVMRQGVFVAKMFKIDWLHSPAARFTMEKALKKYERFFEIASTHPDQAVTPTLDVDLAWHTHQLSPQSYFKYAVSKTGVFTDHNDKIDEDKLAISFDWMGKVYQEKYGEVYSECNCWFCESLRYMHTSRSKLKRLFGHKQDKATEEWRDSGQDAGQHISSHHAVRTADERSSQNRTRRLLFHNNLNDIYEKVMKQAAKGPVSSPATSGTTHSNHIGLRGDDHSVHWGKRVALSGPWSSEAAAIFTEEMYASHPGVIHTYHGQPGACAAGTCGGSTGCGSGGIAMCGSGCTGMGSNYFGAGCQGIGGSSDNQ
ncbi:hypothetical protein PFICI_12709 [Pestalotiopsis fici W106-1]|uniref:Alpha-ketoglutarate-dependent sulfonate dioxygenase n=1 Tax=Pestalotiopsis fici (strain W106-1 / CGMCC3.15140) TaxID=1229662 RepID=W3WPF0_PESFW|nr:uncharacterized protein PFICI_12709 [Pestalotiopsis fici W106-1]ETS75765.1 hypothetical protein PFICI_12709 [Pestalotiopsis fici W106-1]